MWELTKPLVEKWIKENYDPFNMIDDWLDKNKRIIKDLPEIFQKINKILEKIFDKL